MKSVQFFTIPGVPIIKPGDDLAQILVEALDREKLQFETGDVLALAQKIVSKSEGRLVNLARVTPGSRALELATLVKKDPRHVEVILRESKQVIWTSPGIFVVETLQGYVCANAGVDRSNIQQEWEGKPEIPDQKPGNSEIGEENQWLSLLPVDSDASARRVQSRIKELAGVEVAVIINDTHGRPFRMGGVGVALGSAGLQALVDQRGESDIFGYTLQATLVAFGDELASAASLVMGQSAQATPAVLIRGLEYRRPPSPEADQGSKDLIRPEEMDVFRHPAPRN